jgi:hypothetical protein
MSQVCLMAIVWYNMASHDDDYGVSRVTRSDTFGLSMYYLYTISTKKGTKRYRQDTC